MNIDLVSHALALKLLASIAEEADETTLKTALSLFPGIIAAVLKEAVKDMAAAN